MNYIELVINVPEEKSALSEVLVAFLAEQGYESFCEEKDKLLAYIIESNYNEELTKMLMSAYGFSFCKNIIEQKNWNEEWEKHFEPIQIDDVLTIKARFHEQKSETINTVFIEPKMSFGTGHHATTYMMCKLMSAFDMTESHVLDFGCGTGVLSIYASLLGASNIIAIDIDEWAYENSIENANINSVSNISVLRGDINNVPDLKYDFIFANINLNVLLNDIPVLVKFMNYDSLLFVSGFLINELKLIEKCCFENGLILARNIEKDNWSACVFNKM
ncbi:MAG TPA: 50S ribosomal protein L11 methyltransferase [Bacteroidales bacterium]|nr:50S ribosomal protein L11 methyltransferase [Bacteroidales bacterium]